MKNLYTFDQNTGKYTGTTEAEVDEWQSKVAGHACYKGVSSAVWDKPEEKDGYTPYWRKGRWELITDPSLNEVKQSKISELKDIRDILEVDPILYQGYSFDYDSKARERINAAIIALENAGTGASLTWTTADDKDVKVTASDLRGVIAAVALRSDKLHTAYREAKAKVEAAESKEELDAIALEIA